MLIIWKSSGYCGCCQEEQSPLILQVSAGARKYAKHIYLVKLVEAALEDSDLLSLLLRPRRFLRIVQGHHRRRLHLRYDRRLKYDYEENIRLTKQVVEYAHAHGVTVEAELGRLAGIEDDVNVSANDAIFTDPDQAAEFVHKTGVDSLAIAIEYKPWCLQIQRPRTSTSTVWKK